MLDLGPIELLAGEVICAPLHLATREREDERTAETRGHGLQCECAEGTLSSENVKRAKFAGYRIEARMHRYCGDETRARRSCRQGKGRKLILVEARLARFALRRREREPT